MELGDIESCMKDFNDLESDYRTLEVCVITLLIIWQLHYRLRFFKNPLMDPLMYSGSLKIAVVDFNKEYIAKLEEVGELQSKCVAQVTHQRYRLGLINHSVKKLQKAKQHPEKTTVIASLEKDIMRRHAQLANIEQILPKPNGLYLKIILGNVNVSILNKNDKFRYKDEYEKFKLVLSGIGFVMSVLNLLINVRALELSFMFLLVWYYCTLTIRESILKVNGSRIKGWWRLHHFISTVVSGVLLIWPNTATWYQFRTQFMWFNLYISVVQFLQFRYQQGALYRLKALGERHNMDITIEGFHSWMWRGLSFLLPFLYAGYVYQFYNAYSLYQLSFHPEATWQVPVLALMFLVLFLGNTLTTAMVIRQKLKERVGLDKFLKYPGSPIVHGNHKVKSDSNTHNSVANSTSAMQYKLE